MGREVSGASFDDLLSTQGGLRVLVLGGLHGQNNTQEWAGLNKGTKVPTIDVATQGCDNVKCVMYKTAPRIWVLRVWVLQSRHLGGYLSGYLYPHRR